MTSETAVVRPISEKEAVNTVEEESGIWAI